MVRRSCVRGLRSVELRSLLGFGKVECKVASASLATVCALRSAVYACVWALVLCFVDTDWLAYPDVAADFVCSCLVRLRLLLTVQATQTVLTRVPETTPSEFDAAVANAHNAFPGWRDTSLLGRQQVMLK